MVHGHGVPIFKAYDAVASFRVAAIIKLDVIYFMVRVYHDIFKFLLFDLVFVAKGYQKRTLFADVFFKGVGYLLQIYGVGRGFKNFLA